MVFIIRVEQIFFWWEIGGTQKLDRDYDPFIGRGLGVVGLLVCPHHHNKKNSPEF
jgi:hypothetical protein